MLKALIPPTALALALWVAGTGAALAKSLLVVQIRTDCRPMEDFHMAVVTVRHPDGRAIRRVNTPASRARDWARGVRVAEIEVDAGDYRMKVGLRHRRKGMVAERPVRVSVKDRVRVMTVILTCPQPRTDRRSAPGDPAPLPQVRRPLSPTGPSGLPPMSARPDPSPLRNRACEHSVQGRIAWNDNGNKQWSPANIARLCQGAENSTEPGRCFQTVMHGNVSHGTNTPWRWQDALELCAGARNHKSRVDCFRKQISRGAGQRAAISRCRKA